jgi:hypothetical protein
LTLLLLAPYTVVDKISSTNNSVNNAGSITLGNAVTQSLSASYDIMNTGAFTINSGGTVSSSTKYTQDTTGTTIVNGTLRAPSVAVNSGGSLTVNSTGLVTAGAAGLTLGGAGMLTLVGGSIGTGSDTGLTQGGIISGYGTIGKTSYAITNTGAITATNGDLTIDTNATGFTNQNSVTIDATRKLSTPSKYIQSSGTTTVNGTLQTPALQLDGGIFAVSGGAVGACQ